MLTDSTSCPIPDGIVGIKYENLVKIVNKKDIKGVKLDNVFVIQISDSQSIKLMVELCKAMADQWKPSALHWCSRPTALTGTSNAQYGLERAVNFHHTWPTYKLYTYPLVKAQYYAWQMQRGLLLYSALIFVLPTTSGFRMEGANDWKPWVEAQFTAQVGDNVDGMEDLLGKSAITGSTVPLCYRGQL
ncbi:hypothetical protein DAEQUDRAFT_739313 [Daedalea quercina L-15889]|uniref:Uncharacterized protein n=1 Tax=Daedalea quercina L-15889 TaxID=1314783 RepID=A0A165NYW2_9APHY|nr:hypothetical protein DAEQUDRAFT_739313 [Daedalea quercina L-15889]